MLKIPVLCCPAQLPRRIRILYMYFYTTYAPYVSKQVANRGLSCTVYVSNLLFFFSFWEKHPNPISGIGEGPEYRPFLDLRSVPEAGRPREQVGNHRRACTQVPFPELGFFHFSEIVTTWLVPTFPWSEDPSTTWLVPSTAQDPAC